MLAVAPIPQPQGMTFQAWGAQVAEQLSAFGIGAPPDEDSWKLWVCALFYVPELTSLNVPSPEGFSDWRLWASRFCEAVR